MASVSPIMIDSENYHQSNQAQIAYHLMNAYGI
ncbi:hypothetical protein PT2222_120338 [Paraburkholderia tropica]